MKFHLLIISLVFSLSSVAQRKVDPTDTLKIDGKIKHALIFTLSDLDTFQKRDIKDMVIVNHKGEIKDTITGLKGILLKDLFRKMEFQVEKPRELNEFYFVFIASDGYKVVFSWNEIFNTETGNSLYIVTRKEGKKLTEMEDRILLISSLDFNTGRRSVRGLARIVVERVR